MKHKPPKWAEKFLSWYCREDLLDEIQGDIYELFDRKAVDSKRAANREFVWNVIRFFRIKNIKKRTTDNYTNTITTAMLKNNLTVFLRSFRKNPGHSLLSLFGLSIAFACTFLIILWVNNEFAFDRFHADSENIFKVITHLDANDSYQTQFTAGFNLNAGSLPEVEEVTHISTGTRWPHELCFSPVIESADCIYFSGVYASPNLFSTFSFPILSGDPNPLDDVAQIAISEKMSHMLYGDESPLGKIIKIDGTKEVSIAAVFKNIPSQSSIEFDFALPYKILQQQWGINDESLQKQFFDVYLKTVSNVSSEALSKKLNNPSVIGEEYISKKISYEAIPFTQWHLNSVYENGRLVGGRIDYVHLFILIALLVLATAVINFVNLATARASLRAKEIGVRKAIGAVKSSLVIQFMSESFLMVFIAFLLGIVWTLLALPQFNTLVDDTLSLSALDGSMMLYMFGFLIFITLLAGLYPSLVMSSFQSAKILKGLEIKRFNGSVNIRKTLMALQLCLSIGIILFSTVIHFQLNFIRQKNLGFDKENMIRVEPTYRLLKSYDAFKDQSLKSKVISGMTVTNSNPLHIDSKTMAVEWSGKSVDTNISFQTIGTIDNFTELFDLKVLEGRQFFDQNQTEESMWAEAIITESAAKLFGFKNPIGEKIKILNYLDCEIVGVINDFHTASLKESILPVIIYRKPVEQLSGIYIKYKAGHAEEAIQDINTIYKSLEPDTSIKYWFQDETFDKLYKTESIASNLVLAFSLVSILIAIIGIVGLATFNTLRKTKEIGVRRVFGATQLESLLVLVREFVWVMTVALIVAVPVAWFFSRRWLQSYAYRTEIPWVTFAFILIGAIFLILFIIWIQSQKIISTNPTKSLRSD
ncbi:MacB-like protein [Algoriphagus ratkowskyi]|uniref:FtsX-like permease family protein n=1 Tax=Algoriphagus ratkowskyi TaxID=57028 RepID=A0A2W7S3F2_9BACT|nr:ABC transporter permease [Algoriphagus ratkowskyi]PZX57625.1 MacB-like protein [Algoriphagus ratkowskyi]TXD78897.1 FtsX-like permease family protein [Algoriphagus ratkowskyi]